MQCASRSAEGDWPDDARAGRKRAEEDPRGLFGYGLDHEIMDAYKWLIDNYNEGDQLLIFGFSRGAYTARTLSGFISNCGLLKPGSPLSINQHYGRYRRRTDKTIRDLVLSVESGTTSQTTLALEELWLLRYSNPISIDFSAREDRLAARASAAARMPAGLCQAETGLPLVLLRAPQRRRGLPAISQPRRAGNYPDRDVDCLEAMEPGLQATVECMIEAGWARGKVMRALRRRIAAYNMAQKETARLEAELAIARAVIGPEKMGFKLADDLALRPLVRQLG